MPTIPKIKICGLRRVVDAEYINDFPVSFAGFVFAESKRKIDVNTALKIKEKLKPDIKTAGVFTDTTPEEVIKISSEVGLDIVQLHSDENNEFCKTVKAALGDTLVWKSIAVKDGNALKRAEEYDTDGFLLDAYDKTLRGGTGKCFRWELAADFAKKYYTVLAGGISADNIAEAVKIVNPCVIDLSSSVETEGFKDYNKIKKLFEALERI